MSDSLRVRLTALARHRWFNWIWQATVTFIVVVWIASRLDLTQFARVIVAPRWDALVGMLAAALVFVAIGGTKVWILLRAFAPVRLRLVLGYFVVATAFGSFTPAALGDFSIAAYLRRENVPVHQGLSAMLVDRVISVAIYVLVFTPLTLALLVRSDQLWVLPIVFLAAAVFGLLLNANPMVRDFARTRLIRAYVPAAENFARAISDLLRLYPLHLAGNVALTLVRSIVAGLVIQFALSAAHEQADFFSVLCATNFLTVVNLLPISIGGLGVYEGSGVILFEQLGMNGENVLAALLYQRVYILLSSALILLVFWMHSVRHSNGTPARLV